MLLLASSKLANGNIIYLRLIIKEEPFMVRKDRPDWSSLDAIVRHIV